MHSQTFQGLPCRQSPCQVAGIANKKSFCSGTGQLQLLETHKNASGIQCYQRPQLPGPWVALNKHRGEKSQISIKEVGGGETKSSKEKRRKLRSHVGGEGPLPLRSPSTQRSSGSSAPSQTRL